MAKLNDFINYLNSKVNRAIYVWGGQTQIIRNGIVYKDDTYKTALGDAEAWIKKVETSTTNANRVIKLYRKRKDTYDVIPCVDCSGLGMNFLQNKTGLAKSDMTANGMKAKCTAISKNELRKGDWVFRCYTSGSNKGRAYHIGYVVSDDLQVVEAYGRDKGVIKRAFSSDYWNACGRPSYFADEIQADVKYTATFARVLKYSTPLMCGDDVKALQIMLNEAMDADLAEDGIFGKKTLAAVKAYQKLRGLTVDGKAGKNTLTSLGGHWVG